MMRPSTVNLRAFIYYKFFNSLFTGLSVGSVFTLYTPLEPSVFSLGGVVLALAMLVVAKFYVTIMNRHWFYKISLGVEVVMLLLVVYFLLFGYGYMTALLMYIGYQMTFAFGSYLVRAETMLIPSRSILTFLDVAKQKAYLVGMAAAYLFYQVLETYFGVRENGSQIYTMHFVLVAVECITIALLVKAFRRK